MFPNTTRTKADRGSTALVFLAVAILTSGCKASGHIHFEIDIPALELEIQPPDRSPEP